jgi:hypothetical protein
VAKNILIAIVSFLLGAAFVEIVDPLGPRSYNDCVYQMVKKGSVQYPSFAQQACRLRFPVSDALDELLAR